MYYFNSLTTDKKMRIFYDGVNQRGHVWNFRFITRLIFAAYNTHNTNVKFMYVKYKGQIP